MNYTIMKYLVLPARNEKRVAMLGTMASWLKDG